MKKLSKKQILMLHTQLIQQTGGSDGVRDYNLLDSALENPFQSFGGEELYPTIQAKAARLGYGLIKNHCMIDGNKRIGTHAMLVFLALNTPLEIVEYCQKNGIAVEAYSPIAHGEILNQPQIKEMADKYGVSVPQLCIRYTLQLGAISLPKTGNPAHMKTNADVDFEISAEDMEVLKHFKKIESYGANSGFPVYGGRL